MLFPTQMNRLGEGQAPRPRRNQRAPARCSSLGRSVTWDASRPRRLHYDELFHYRGRQYAGREPARLVLIDGARLTELMVRHNVGVLEEQTFILERVDEEFFE